MVSVQFVASQMLRDAGNKEGRTKTAQLGVSEPEERRFCRSLGFMMSIICHNVKSIYLSRQ